MEFLFRDGYISDLDYLEDIPLQDILLDFLNYPIWLWVDSVDPLEENLSAKEFYLRELIWGYLHPPLVNEVLTPGKKNRTFNINIQSNRHDELEQLQKDIVDLVNNLSDDSSKATFPIRPLRGPDIKYKISISKGKIEEIYTITSIDAYCLFAITNLSKRDILIKRCLNCGNYFIPSSRSDEQYCDNIFKNGRTCKQLGWEIKAKDDPAYATFRKAYSRNRKFIKSKKNKLPQEIYNIIENSFSMWQYESNNKRELIKESEVTLHDFKNWIKGYDDKLRFLVKYVEEGSEISTNEFLELVANYNSNEEKEV